MDWRDYNRDGKVDVAEEMLAMEIICGSREEQEALLGDDGDFEEENEFEEDDDFAEDGDEEDEDR
ncbi:MAG: hypothetical protein PUH86_04670 [Lachnospiraceae bacterium]|nr:hypothetical protein [Lachnospiraceae bacterium]